MSIGVWHKPEDRMPCIGVTVVAAYPDDRHVVLCAYPEADGWHWTYADGKPAAQPEFWLEPRDSDA
jgi:hypothetical protein